MDRHFVITKKLTDHYIR